MIFFALFKLIFLLRNYRYFSIKVSIKSFSFVGMYLIEKPFLSRHQSVDGLNVKKSIQ